MAASTSQLPQPASAHGGAAPESARPRSPAGRGGLHGHLGGDRPAPESARLTTAVGRAMAGAPRRRSRSGSAARLLFLALSLWAVAADEGPRLLLLGLRCADRPLDLQPRFSPTHYVYTATLDFSDGGYSIDVLTPKAARAQRRW